MDIKRKRGHSMSILRRVVVEYEDGSTKAMDFNKLSRTSQLEISRAVDCSPSLDMYSAKYLLLGWRDGWHEVIATNGDSIELLRYHVIRRIEDQGRLALEVGTSYPQLFIIDRMPRDLNSLLILDSNSAKYYELDSEVETWEGIFEAGGKKEYVKYDKTDPRYLQEYRESEEILSKLMNSVKLGLEKEKLSTEDLLAKDKSIRTKEYEKIAQEMGIRGKERQQDVYGFIELLVTRLAASAI
jgi:hypothetical protein